MMKYNREKTEILPISKIKVASFRILNSDSVRVKMIQADKNYNAKVRSDFKSKLSRRNFR